MLESYEKTKKICKLFQSWGGSKQVALCLQGSIFLPFRVENYHFETIVISESPPQNESNNEWCFHTLYKTHGLFHNLLCEVGPDIIQALILISYAQNKAFSHWLCSGLKAHYGRVFTANALPKSE